MSSNSSISTENKSPSASSSEIKPREMTVDEYAELVGKWQQAYYTWNASCVNYYKYEWNDFYFLFDRIEIILVC